MTVTTFDDERLERLLAECDPYLLKYINALKESASRWQGLTQDAIKKLRDRGEKP